MPSQPPPSHTPAGQFFNFHRSELLRRALCKPQKTRIFCTWRWSNLYFSSAAYTHWSKSNKCATALEVYNAEFSPIYQLPPELLLMVVDLLPTADILSLLLSSRRFASLIRRIRRVTKEKPTHDDKRELKKRLERDHYLKLANAEPSDTGGLDELLCSFCLKPHTRYLFDSGEVAKSAHTRQCKGAARKFHACQHLSVTFKELKAHVNLWSPVGYMICTDFNCKLEPIVSGSSSTLDIRSMSECIPERIFPRHNTVYRDDVRTYLKEQAQPVCPHMSTDDDAFGQLIMEAPLGGSSRPLNEPLTSVFAEPYSRASMFVWCRAPGCSTNVQICRSSELFGEVVSASICRNLGKLEDPLDPAWLAQIGVDCSRLLE